MLKLYPQRTVLAVNFLTSFSAWNEADIYQKPSALTSNLRSNSQWSVSKPNTSNETVSWGKETLVSVLVSNGYRSSFVQKLAKTTRVTVKFPHSPILHYAFSSWIEKTMTKTIAIGNTDFFHNSMGLCENFTDTVYSSSYGVCLFWVKCSYCRLDFQWLWCWTELLRNSTLSLERYLSITEGACRKVNYLFVVVDLRCLFVSLEQVLETCVVVDHWWC